MKLLISTATLITTIYSMFFSVDLFSGFEVMQYTSVLVIFICSTCVFGIIEHQFEKGGDNE
ncbi:hypothetical protein [Pseudoalteromonas phage H105/1]|uniref:hypothetical protein n=1 Tax=Pseudoalteromonas phage H105/1 TaxID=877240 RepID=UPI0001E439E4|nr:hypothetical protein AV949_gp33 [Pseudoalteromonas phage H105/1]ADM26693.1 hypothetical protein [Pseudoalteromonas phage H105/1]